MARAIWSGSLAFGLVNVPVSLYSATESKDVHFHQFQSGTGKRVRNMRVVEGTDKEVAYDDIVKGYEVTKGKYVMVTREELEAVEPGRSRTIDIEDFVSLAEIDPIWFEKTYYVAPGRAAGADKPYALLLRAMLDTERVGIARFVMRDKQYLAAIRPVDDVLVLETLYFADEVRDARDIPGVPAKTSLSQRERDIAERLIESLTTEWDPSRYEDTYRERVLDLIRRKGKGEEIDVSPREEPADNVVDLMAALQASLEIGRAAAGRSAARSSGTSSATTGAKAKKAAAPARSSSSTKRKPASRSTTKSTAKRGTRKAS